MPGERNGHRFVSSSMVRVRPIWSRNQRSWLTSRSVPSYVDERLLELLDGGQVEVVGGLVEHEAVDALGRERGELGPRALARRELTDLARRPRRRRGRTWRAGSGPRSGPARCGPGTRPAAPGRRRRPIAVDRAVPTRTPGPHHRARHRPSGSSPSSAASRVDLPDPLGPTMPTRSCQWISTSTGPSANDAPLHDRVVEPTDDIAAALVGAQVHVQLPALPRLVDGRRAGPAASRWPAPWPPGSRSARP